MRKRALALSSVVVLIAAAGPAWADYLIMPVDTPDGFSRLTGINNAGDVVGVTTVGNPFLTPAGGAPRLIQLPPHGPAGASWAGINNVGEIVGSFRGPGSIADPLAQFVGASGFIDSHGTLTQLNVPGAENTYPTAINDRGVVAGYAFTPSFYQGFTYSNGVYTIVNAGPPSTDFGTRIYGINNAGDLVGTYESPRATIQAFLVHDGVTTLFDVPGFESVLYDNPGTEAFDINDRGQIVGWAQQGIEGLTRGFIETNGRFDLLDFQIFGINDRGQLLSRSAIATPVPEPGSGAMLAIGLLGVAMLRRQRRPSRASASRPMSLRRDRRLRRAANSSAARATWLGDGSGTAVMIRGSTAAALRGIRSAVATVLGSISTATSRELPMVGS
jgi:uncharacterized membrane protein